MEFDQFIRPYLKWFYICGQSPCPANYDFRQQTKQNIFTSAIACTLLLALGGLALAFANVLSLNFLGFNRWSITEIIIINIVTLCDITRLVFVLFQCIVYRKHAAAVVKSLRQLSMYFMLHLQHRIVYRKFNRQYLKKAVVMFIVYIPDLYLIIIGMVEQTNSPIYAPIKCLQLLRAANSLHVVFYVDIFQFFLTEFDVVSKRWCTMSRTNKNDQVFNVSNLGRPDNSLITTKQLKYFKHVHFELWMVTRKLNEYLGWSILAILLHSFIDFVYAMFWLTMQWQVPWKERKLFDAIASNLTVVVNVVILVDSCYYLQDKAWNRCSFDIHL